MSEDLSPHQYRPLRTPRAHCAVCLGTVRNDFCQPRRGIPAVTPEWWWDAEMRAAAAAETPAITNPEGTSK